jgi:hypothetical protein
MSPPEIVQKKEALTSQMGEDDTETQKKRS